ncbi:MAG: amino acid adenylation domain-containing protein, partial [Blastocatellia bacterium]
MQKTAIAGFHTSPQQKRLWTLLANEQAAPYIAQCRVTIERQLDVAILKAALEEVVGRHEILRTTFRPLPGASLPLQVIKDRGIFWHREQDLRSLGPQAQESSVRALFDESRRTSFDLSNGPVLHVSRVILSPSRCVLLICLPALCADLATLNLIVSEIGRSYEALARRSEQSGEVLRYVVVAEWQNELLISEDAETARAYWREKDYSGLFNLKLPFEGQAARDSVFNTVSVEFVIPASLLEKIENQAGIHGASPEAFVRACYQVMLWRLTGESNIVIGAGYDGRTDDELKNTLGPLSKYLPIGSRLKRDSLFKQVLKEGHENAIEAYDWQEWFTWDQILRADLNTTAPDYFPFVFDYADEPSSCAALDLTFRINERYACSDRFKIRLSFTRGSGSSSIRMEYDSGLYTSTDIERLADYLQTLLESAAENPETEIQDLEILSPAHRRQILVEFNNTSAHYPFPKCIHSIFALQAERSPNNLAAVCEDQHLTYAEMDASSNQLANRLKRMGVGPDAPVAICMDRSLSMIVGLLGILKAGAAYVPLDPDYPKERLAFMLKDAQALVLLTQDHLAQALTDLGHKMIVIDRQWDEISSESKAAPFTTVTPENLAYIIYTSGSTGRPKGVMISHQAICNRILWMQATHPLSETDKVLQKTVFTFDASIWEFFLPLFSGAQLVFAKPGGHRDTGYLADLIAREGITTLQLVPSMLQVFLDEPGVAACARLRRVFCGGEALPASLKDRFFAMMKADLHNLYGPTEAAIDAASWSCEREPGNGIVPIGKPIANDQLYIVGERLHPVPPGVAGELRIGGVGLARGYLNRPDLTAEKFLPDPFGEKPGARLYQTGDLARLLADGNIEYLGRVDYQVKIRGFRIELGEIETVLSAHPGVRESVVMAKNDETGNQRLVAYVVGTREQALTNGGRELYQLPNKLRVAHLNKNETDLLYKEIFEDRFYLRHGVTINEGDCIFDVGANIGLFTLFVQTNFKNVSMYSFEPIPPSFEALQTNVAMHGLKVKPYHCGVSDHSGT